MLIRIIDVPAQGNEDDSVRIQYQGADHNKTYQTELYTSPFSANFRKTLAWYFCQYPGQYQLEGEFGDDKGVVQKVIRAGQGIGDELIGEDYELVQIAEDIIQGGYEQLDVEFVSLRPSFFSEIWETMILPDAKYMLSTVAKSFVRRIGDVDTPKLPSLSYNLKVTAPTSEHVAQMLQGMGEAPKANDRSDDKPLRVLHWVARPQSVTEAFDGSNGINQALEAKRGGSAIIYDVQKAGGLDKLTELLSDKNNPVHVLHYDGPVLIDGSDEVSFVVNDDEEISIGASALCKLLVEHNVGLLTVDARRYLRHTPKTVLAMIAKSAYEQGLGNILGLSQLTNPWLSGKCFDGVYRLVASGLELSQAVVEARKNQQRTTTTELFTPKAVNFHDWSLLVHYSHQKVQFFDSGLPIEQQDDPNYLADINQKLFGYQSKMLPPLHFSTGDGQALELLKLLQNHGGVVACASQGGGKSALAHSVSTYLAAFNHIDFGFYFDFAKETYEVEHMLEMLANLLQLPVGQNEQLFKALAQKRCLFVFDDIDQAQSDVWSTLLDFVGTLRQNGHQVIATGKNSEQLSALDLPEVDIKPLSLIEQKMLAAHTLRQLNADEIKDLDSWHELLESAKGNPWLTIKLMGKLSTYSLGALKGEMEKHIQHSDAVVEQFYQWQWSKLPAAARQVLLLCADVRGLLLEMVATAADQKADFTPAGQFFALLGEQDEAKFSDWVNELSSAGFVNTYPHGRMIDLRCLPFLSSHRELLNDNDALKLCFSQLVCEGVRILSGHVLKQPNQNISNNLLFNRRSWVAHLEVLWQAKDYRGFFNVKNTFDQLLMQAQLLPESEYWGIDLLSRHQLDDNSDINDKVAWLSMAASFALNEKCDDYDYVGEAQSYWRDWFDGLGVQMTDEQRPLFQQALTFLQGSYQRQQKWQDAIAVSEKGLQIYQDSEAWQRVIRALKALSDYHGKLGDEDQALEYECRILDDIPYDNAPPSFKAQQMVEIMLARLTRGNTTECQKMLDQLKDTTEEGQNLASILDNVQCEIFIKEGNHEKALPLMCEQWLMALQTNQPQQLEPLKARMAQLSQALGEETFNAIFADSVPAGTPSPVEVQNT